MGSRDMPVVPSHIMWFCPARDRRAAAYSHCCSLVMSLGDTDVIVVVVMADEEDGDDSGKDLRSVRGTVGDGVEDMAADLREKLIMPMG
jgi:hypothetical protein